jgi:hypothetical protein
MSTQAALDFTPAQASREAAERIEPDAKSLRGLILEYIREQTKVPDSEKQPKGATCWECEEARGIKHQTCSARIRDLRELGFIKASGRSRKTGSGCNAVVYVVAETKDDQYA